MTSNEANNQSKRKRGWTHPIHARGVRSPQFENLAGGKLLTDKDIDRYIREGRYGTEAQMELLEAEAKSKKPKSKRERTRAQKREVKALFKKTFSALDDIL